MPKSRVGAQRQADPLHDDDQIAIPRQHRIGSHQPQRRRNGLRHQQAVEWITVMQRQARRCRGMHGANRQFKEPALLDRRHQFMRVGFDLPEPGLDADLPDRRG